MKYYYFYRTENTQQDEFAHYRWDTRKKKNYLFRSKRYLLVKDLVDMLNILEYIKKEKYDDCELFKVITSYLFDNSAFNDIEVNKEHSVWKQFN